MAETPLTDSIEALTTYANQVTGASDINLSDAVYTLTRGYGGGGQEVPVEYDELAGILFTGTQLLNTGYTWNADTEIKFIAQKAYGTEMNAFANIISATNYYIGYGTVNNIYYKFGSAAEISVTGASITAIGQFDATINGISAQYLTPTGQQSFSGTIASTTVTTTGELIIGGITTRPWYGTLFAFEVLENSVKIARMIPAKRKSDNVIGLYDVIRNAFYVDSNGNGFTGLTYADLHSL